MRRAIALVIAAVVALSLSYSTRADGVYPIFLPGAPTSHNIQATQLDVNYKVADLTKHWGVFSATGKAANLDGRPITGGNYGLTAYFSLDTGTILSASVKVTGTIDGHFQTFFDSSQLAMFGYSSAEDTFDFRFSDNHGTVGNPTSWPSTKILGMSILGTQTYGFQYALTSGSYLGQTIWDNDPQLVTVNGKTFKGPELGTANIWAPLPNTAVACFALMGVTAFGQLLRRRRDVAWVG